MATTTQQILPPPVQQYFDERILSTPTANYIHKIPAEKKYLPAGGGTTLRMRRYNQIGSAPVPLGNAGVHPPAKDLTAVDIDAEVNFYGTFIRLQEQVTLQAQDPVLNSAALRLGQSLRTTEDELTRDMLAGTAAFINCDQGLNGDNPTEITRADLNGIVEELMNNNAMTISDNIEGEDKFGTAPVRDAFFALCNTRLIGDLDAIQGFINKAQYPNQMNVLRSEWGTASNVRFLVSSLGSITQNASANNNDVYNVFCTGMEAYACVEQDEYSSEFIYRPPIYDGPLALNASVGYKFAETPRILNDLWVLNLRCTRA